MSIFVPPRQARAMLGVSRTTLRRWEDAGIIRAFRLGSSGHRRYLLDDLRDLINGRCSV